MECPNCDGTGEELYLEPTCCGDYLDSGECCAAINGGANMVLADIPYECEACGGSGVI